MDLTENLRYSENSNRTKEGLPKLTMETLNAFNREIRKRIDDGEVLEPLLEKWSREFELENPVLLNHIYYFVGAYPPDMQGITAFRFVMLYHLLKMQAINDNLSSSQRIFEYFNRTK